MKIRPRNIPTFQNGGGVPQWYLDRYGNRTLLLGWDLNKRYNYANLNLNTNDHRNAGNLDTVYKKNVAYTGTPGAISSDILTFYNSDGKGMSAEDFVNFYNSNASKIRGHWAQDLTYNAKTAGEHNRLFKRMFASRSNLSQSPGSDYNIGYLNNLEDVEGSSTWLRRMDLYENEFDPNNPDSNRLHEITLSDGSKATVYKKANGDIGLLPNQLPTRSEAPTTSSTPETSVLNPITGVPAGHNDKYGFDWNKIRDAALKVFGNPDLYAVGRLAGNLYNNERVYDELLKGIRPVLRLTYNTHRQVVGDEATKQGYYRRAAQGQTRAARPFTSDADRQMAYMMEARRVGDELRAQGDLADNAEIRRTSDESNQHQWANTQRATEVANANIASINLTNALKHNLLALKHSAQWSSIDNFLQGIEYRKRQKLAEQQALDDLIFTLLEKSDLANDPDYLSAYDRYSKIIEANTDKTTGNINWNDATLAAKRDFERAQTEAMVRSYQRRKLYYQNKGTIFAKSGAKVTHKKKDDLLYKSTRDTVDHFRKMSKISSDALNRRTPKIEKLTSHPKGKTRKYLLGGVAPFTVYKPVALGGETTTSSEASTSSTAKSSGSKNSDGLDLMKELFKSLSVEGLPSDVNGIYYSMNSLLLRQKAFGTELSSDDIASMYLLLMLKINTIKFNKALFDKTMQTANSNDALSEYAVNELGQIAALNRSTGEVTFMKWEELKEKFDKYNPLTNGDLLNLRAYSPDLAFNYKILEIVNNNGIGMSKIAEFLKAQLPKLGSSELTLEGYTKQDSNLIKEGIELLKDAPAGDYKFSQYTKDLLKQAEKALEYLASILPKNMKTVLKINADMLNTTVPEILLTMIGSTMSKSSKLEFDAVTGKAVKDKDGKSKDEGIAITSGVKLLTGIGEPRTYTFNIGNGNSFDALGRVSDITDANDAPFGADFSYSEIYKSSLRNILDLDNASFGDVPINKALKDRIVVDNSTIVGVDLPYKVDGNGRIIPNFLMLAEIEKADEEVMRLGINPETDPLKVNEVYAKHNLPIKYGANNLLTGNYKRFAVIQGTAIEDVFLNKEGLSSNGTLTLATDEEEINKYLGELSKITGQKDIDLDRPGWLTGNKDIYKGSIFIPIVGDISDAMMGSKSSKLTSTNQKELLDKWNTRNYLKPPNYVKE